MDENDHHSLKNFQFYTNKIPSSPEGDFIDIKHKDWFGKWSLLERHHGYIQWLMPIRESGLNMSSQPFSMHESELFRRDPAILRRVLKSYELMLDFYGLVLLNENTGQIARNAQTYSQIYKHLNYSFHNYLRITRILKHLGIVGFEHLKFGFLHHMCLEIFKEGLLPNVSDSFVRFWAPTLRNPQHLHYIDNLTTRLGRKVDRKRRDGYGDEDGDNWSTQLHDTNALVNVPVDILNLKYVKEEKVAICNRSSKK